MFIKKHFLIAGTIAIIGIAVFIAGLVLYLTSDRGCSAEEPSKQKKGFSGGIVTNGHECAQIGSSILQKNGSVVDAAIAALFCEGVAMPQSTGLGGGFFMTIYIHSTREVIHLDAREVAPLAAFEDMYNGNASLAARGGLSVAVPGELRGYWYAWKKYGNLPWKDLVQPTINLCREGHLVTSFLAKLLKSQEQKLLDSPTLREIYINSATNKTWEEGQHIKRETLAKTLEIIAEEGADALYNGSLTKQFVKDLKDMGGIIEEEDMNLYEPKWEPPFQAKLSDDLTLYSSPLPGSGIILSFITNILSGFLKNGTLDSVTNYQRVVESFKYGYGKRTELGDPDFVAGIEQLVANLTSIEYASEIRSKISDTITYNDPEHYGANTTLPEDHGTANVAIIAPNGDAVTATGTINLYFGAYLRSRSTGIILNDEMDDFSAPNITNSFDLPPSPANYIRPRKRPMSSMCPTIVVDGNGDARLAIGAAGGSKITTSVALVTLRHLWFGSGLKEAIDDKRLHHQLFPMSIYFEQGFDNETLNAMGNIGHKYSIAGPQDGFAAVTAVSKFGKTVEAAYDKRRTGSIALF